MANVAQATIQIGAEGAEEAERKLSGVGDALSAIGNIASTVAAVGLAAVVSTAGFAVSEMMSSQDAVAGLNATLNSTGRAGEISSGALSDMASNLQDVTRFSDEAAMGAETMLLRFENIGANIFPQALSASADLAAAMGTDLASAANVVGRALDNPAEGIGRLNQQFKLFTKDQMEAIQAMAETGDVAGAQAAILDALNQKVGGTAEAMGNTLAGRVERLKNKISDLGEEIGFRLLPFLEGAMNGADFFFNAVEQGVSPLTALEAALRVGGLGFLADGLHAARDALAPLMGPLGELGTAIQTVAPNFMAAGEQILGALQRAFGEAGPQIIANIGSAISALADIITVIGPQIAANIGQVGSVIAGGLAGALTLVTGVISGILQLLSGDFPGALATVGNSLAGFANSVSQAVGGVDFSAVLATWGGVFEQLGIIVSAAGGIVVGAIGDAAAGVMAGAASIVLTIANAAQSVVDTASAWAAAGRALIDGLAGAIKAGAATVIAAAVGVAEAAIRAVKAALGIASPSKVMMDIGANVTDTLADALSGGTSMPIAAASNMGSAVGAAVAGPALGGLRGSGGGSAGGAGAIFYITIQGVADAKEMFDKIEAEARTRGFRFAGAA